MDWWQRVMGTALLGTDRQSPPIPQSDAVSDSKGGDSKGGDRALTTAVQQLAWDTHPNQAILETAAMVALHHQMGQTPQTKSFPPLAACPVSDRPCCSTQVSRYLSQCQRDYSTVLPELLTLISTTGQRVPEAVLPQLLDMGCRNPDIRPAIIAVMGQRGQWLAPHNPDWHYAVVQANGFDVDAVQAIWKNGTRMERLAILTQWRHHDTYGARAALEETWENELAKDREAFLSVLASGLSMADEPFLESCLDDRAKSVRKAAIALLQTLPNSSLCQRMAQRVQSHIQLESTVSGTTIKVTLPDDYVTEWDRDGMVQIAPKKDKSKRQGKRAGWLYQMIASTPLRVWQGEPDAIAAAIKGHEWQAMLLEGWAIASQRQRNPVWAAALLQQFDLQTFEAIAPPLAQQLRTLLPLDQQEVFLHQQLPLKNDEVALLWLQQVAYLPRSGGASDCSDGGQAEERSPHSWSLDFSQGVLNQLEQQVKRNAKNRYQFINLLSHLALTLHPDIAPEMETVMDKLAQNSTFNPWYNSFAYCHGCLSFRRNIYQALGKSPILE